MHSSSPKAKYKIHQNVNIDLKELGCRSIDRIFLLIIYFAFVNAEFDLWHCLALKDHQTQIPQGGI